MRFSGAVPLALILALALLALSAHDYWTSRELTARALAGMAAGLLGALAALRLGWAYCPAGVADVLNRTRGPFNVNAPAIAATPLG